MSSFFQVYYAIRRNTYLLTCKKILYCPYKLRTASQSFVATAVRLNRLVT